MTSPYVSVRVASLLVLLPLSGCVQDLTPPELGSCANYPEGAFDYGEVGIGTCLAAPTDLRFYDDGLGPVLLVVNSNNYQNFSSGSLLPLPWNTLEVTLNEIRDGLSSTAPDEAPLPVSLLLEDLIPPEAHSAYPLPNYSGKVATDVSRKYAFVTNRLSLTTDSSIDDRVYGVNLEEPLFPVALDLTDGEGAPAEGDEAFYAQEDPYGIVRSDCSRYLYVVNESSPTVSVVDSSVFPIEPLNEEAIGLASAPEFYDVGLPSSGELAGLLVSGLVPEDRFSLTVNEGTYRAWYRGEGLGDGGSLGFADSSDGLTFRANPLSPVLSPGEDDQSRDKDGIGRSSIVPYSSSGDVYLMFYEGRVYSASADIERFRIGRATVSTSPDAVVRYDVGANENVADDAVLEPVDGTFDSNGVGRPWVFWQDENLVLWYTATDSFGVHRLGAADSDDDGISWTNRRQLSFGDEAGFDQVYDATGFYDTALERYRMWLIGEVSGKACLVYAESEAGTNFELGPLEGGHRGCLDLPTEALLSSPSVLLDGGVLRLWYSSTTAEDGIWKLHMARGFNGVDWVVSEENPVLGGGESWEGGDPAATVVKMTAGNLLRFSGEAYGTVSNVVSPGTLVVPMTDSDGNVVMSFTVVHGPVLYSGRKSEYRSDEESFAGPSWDSANVGSPAFDPATGALLYSGWDASGVSAVGEATPVDEAEWRYQNAETPLGVLGNGASDPELIRYEDQVYLYYTFLDGEFSTIRLAVGKDLASLAVVLGFELTAPEAPMAAPEVAAPTVLPPGGGDTLWHMWFTLLGEENSIAHATSRDGITWDSTFEPVLVPGPGGDWDDTHVESPSVIRLEDGSYQMWYSGYDGAVYQVGLATATPDRTATESERVDFWTRQTDDRGESIPVLANDSNWWDIGGALDPAVVYDVATRSYLMVYEGRLGSFARVGKAESRDGIHWTKIFAPFSVGDQLTFATKTVIGTGSGEEPSGLVDGAIPLDFELGSLSFSGRGAAEIAMAPDCSIAVVGARYTYGAYILDIRDDSSGEFFDANFNGVEAVVVLDNNAYDSSSSSSKPGLRSIVFSPDGSRFYGTMAEPDSLVVFDRNAIGDAAITRALRENVLLGSIPLERGSVEDKGEESTGDVGPISPVITSDGRYLFVANANANTVYTVDLALGLFGEVVEVARNVGELPVSLALSPDEKYLLVANYVGEVERPTEDRNLYHGTLAVIDADRTSPTFGQTLAWLKNLELKD